MSKMNESTPQSVFESLGAARLSRRQAFKLAAAGAGAAAFATGLERFDAAAALDPNTLVIGRNIDDAITLDPATAGEETYSVVVRSAYDTLVTTDPANPSTIVPQLAESWVVAPDAMRP